MRTRLPDSSNVNYRSTSRRRNLAHSFALGLLTTHAGLLTTMVQISAPFRPSALR
jgi:hypothetical protein